MQSVLWPPSWASVALADPRNNIRDAVRGTAKILCTFKKLFLIWIDSNLNVPWYLWDIFFRKNFFNVAGDDIWPGYTQYTEMEWDLSVKEILGWTQ